MRAVPGLFAAVVGAGVAFLLSFALEQIGLTVPALTLCVGVGIVMSIAGLGSRSGLRAGFDVAGKQVMRLGIVLLGLSISFAHLLSLGLPMVIAIVGLLVVSFLFTFFLGRMFGLPGRQPLLMAAGFSICGASAIGAVGQASGASQRDQGVPVALVTLFGTAAIVVLPLAAVPLGVSGNDFGIWAGAAVHDVGQVVATASIAGSTVLATAVMVKMVRVLCLAPMVAIVSGIGRKTAGGKRPPIVPLFIIGFLVLAAARTWLPVPDVVLEWVGTAQHVLLGVALVGLLAKVQLRDFAGQGWRSVAVAAGASAFIAIGALLVINTL